MNMNTCIGKIELDHVIMNAAGVRCITAGDLSDLDNNPGCAAIITKSTTLLSRRGNELPRYYDTPQLSINSSGLPNLGYKFYAEYPRCSKPYIISVSGLTTEDNITMIKYISWHKNVDGIELNLSCPNIEGKSQVGYNFEDMDRVLSAVSAVIAPRLNFGIKLPPYFDIEHFRMAAEIINRYPIDTITCINSLGNGLVIDPETETTRIKPKDGYGGIGGSVIKPIALANVRQFSKLTKCSIIGCGGITCGRDVYEHLLCGASAVQIGTEFYKDPLALGRILLEFAAYITEKKYITIEHIPRL